MARADGTNESDEGYIARRLLLMVAELHRLGYQRLRICPYMYATGHWRCTITTADNTLKSHGARIGGRADAPVARHTSGWGDRCFDWDDGPGKRPAELALLFVARFPELCAAGHGPDQEYADWFAWMLSQTASNELPYSFTEYTTREDVLYTSAGKVLRLPPGGGWDSAEDA